MLFTTVIGLFLGVWSLIFLLDYYFRTKNLHNYLNFVESTGLVVSPFQLRLYAGRFQRVLDQWSWLKKPAVKRFLDLWFFIGVGAAVTSTFFMLWLLTGTLLAQLKVFFQSFHALAKFQHDSGSGAMTSSSMTSNGHVTALTDELPYSESIAKASSIVPVVPGVNLPWSQAPLLFIVLIISGIVHELGHAIAAVNEKVTVNGFGIFILGIYPGAFTELENDALDTCQSFKKLKIFCAGIWHNLTAAFLALICISALPRLLSFAYMTDKGVIVTNVHPLSGLNDHGGLKPGDVVYEINYCKVYNEEAWSQCLSSMVKQNFGYCVPKLQVKTAGGKVTQKYKLDEDGGELKCCRSNATDSHLCFYYKTTLTEDAFNGHSNSSFAYSCLRARFVTDHYPCNFSKPCGPQAVCVYPALFNDTKLFRFHIESVSSNNKNRPAVLFIGYPRAISNHVTVSGYVPRSAYAPVWLPPLLDLFFRYLFTFSLAFGLLNAVPCYTLDGQFITAVLVGDSRCCHHGHHGRATTDGRRSITVTSGHRPLVTCFYKAVMWYGTLTLVSVVLFALLSFLRPLFA